MYDLNVANLNLKFCCEVHSFHFPKGYYSRTDRGKCVVWPTGNYDKDMCSCDLAW